MLNEIYDTYSSSVTSIYDWCVYAIPRLEICINLYSDIDNPKVAQILHKLVQEILQFGLNTLEKSAEQLKASVGKLTNANRTMTELGSTLENEFKRIESLEAAASDLRYKLYGGIAALSIVATGGGSVPAKAAVAFVKTYSGKAMVALGVTVLATEASLQNKFDNTRASWNSLKSRLQEDHANITRVQNVLREEIKSQKVINNKIRVTETEAKLWTEIPDVMFKRLESSIRQLIELCNQYIAKVDCNRAHGLA